MPRRPLPAQGSLRLSKHLLEAIEGEEIRIVLTDRGAGLLAVLTMAAGAFLSDQGTGIGSAPL